MRGLDILTSKETIEAKLLELTFVYMKNCAIVKDNYTGVSRGFAFVEYNSIHVMRTSFENENMFSNFLFIGFGLSLREITNDNTWSRNRWQSCDCSFFEKQFCYFVSIALSLSLSRIVSMEFRLDWHKFKMKMKISITNDQVPLDIVIDTNTIKYD